MIRLGLIVDLYDSPGGVGRYVRELVKGLRSREDVQLVPIGTEDRPAVDLPSIVRVPVPPGLLGVERRKLLSLRATLTRLDLDVVHEPYNFAPRWPAASASVLTIHDLMPLKFPHRYGLKSSIRAGVNVVLKGNNPTRIIADSHSTAKDIRRFLGKRVYEKTHVIPLAVDHERFKPLAPAEREAERRRLFERRANGVVLLYVGHVSTQKHVHLLARMMQHLPHDVSLVIAGGPGSGNGMIASAAKRDPRIQLMGRVAEQELPYYLAAADVFTFPSPYEGFGLPPLEAMACGTPPVVANAGSLPEIAAQGGAFFEAGSVDSLVAAIMPLVSDASLRVKLGREAFAASKLFTWQRTIEMTREVYVEASSRGR